MWLVGIVGLVPRWLLEDAWDLYEWLELVREVSQTSMLNWMQVAETICSAAILWAANLLVHISCADTNGWVVSWQGSAVHLTMVRKYLSLLSLCACLFPQVTSGGPTKTLCNMVIFSASADFWCHFKPMKIHGPWAHWNFLRTTSTNYKLWIWSPNADSPASATDSLWPCDMLSDFTSSYLQFTSLHLFLYTRSIWANGNVAHGLGGIPDTHRTEETLQSVYWRCRLSERLWHTWMHIPSVLQNLFLICLISHQQASISHLSLPTLSSTKATAWPLFFQESCKAS